MGKVVGALVALIGIAILAAGACVLIKPEESRDAWLYEKRSEALGETSIVGGLLQEAHGTLTENPAEGDIIAQIGYRVIDIHHSIGVFDVAEANSLDEARSSAQTAGLVTAGFGVLLLIIGGVVGSSGGEKETIVKEKVVESSSGAEKRSGNSRN